MYITGDYIENKAHFSEVLWGPATTHYVARAHEMSDGRWAEVFRCLNAVVARKKQTEYANHGGPQLSDARPPVPDSDSDSELAGLAPEDEVDGGEGIPFPMTHNPLG